MHLQRMTELYLFQRTNFKFLFKKYFLNLVKSFLTSITFYSLSERNLCLVINKNSFSRSIFMQNIKKIFNYVVVGTFIK